LHFVKSKVRPYADADSARTSHDLLSVSKATAESVLVRLRLELNPGLRRNNPKTLASWPRNIKLKLCTGRRRLAGTWPCGHAAGQGIQIPIHFPAAMGNGLSWFLLFFNYPFDDARSYYDNRILIARKLRPRAAVTRSGLSSKDMLLEQSADAVKVGFNSMTLSQGPATRYKWYPVVLE